MEIEPISKHIKKTKIKRIHKIMFAIGILLGIVASIIFVGGIK